jgi:hypothetical protein
VKAKSELQRQDGGRKARRYKGKDAVILSRSDQDRRRISAADAWRSKLPGETVGGAEIVQASSSDAFRMTAAFFCGEQDGFVGEKSVPYCNFLKMP